MVDIIIIGCSGLVGKTLIQIIQEYSFPIDKLVLVGNSNVGEIINVNNNNHKIVSIADSLKMLLIAPFIFYCTDSKIVEESYFEYIDAYPDCKIIDNSSYFRESMPIIIPPINKHLIAGQNIYPNPNCTTSGIVMVLYPINKVNKVTEVRVTSFQAVSGSGYEGINQLQRERKGDFTKLFYDKPICNNIIPQIGPIKNSISEEESKVMNETRKILDNADLDIYATCVRIPVDNCHSVSLEFKLEKETNLENIVNILSEQTMLSVFINDIIEYDNCKKHPNVVVTRLRKHNNSFFCFITFDNLYRGAAYNSYEIAYSILNS